MHADNLIPGCAVLIGAVIAAQTVLYRRFLDRLRQEHPATWRELGSPVMSLNLSSGWMSGRATWRFLAHRAYAKLRDPQITRYGRWLHWLQAFRLLVLVVFLLLVLRFVFS